MKVIKLVGRLTLAPLKDRYEGLLFIFGDPVIDETLTRYNAVVSVGRLEGGTICSLEIIMGQPWDGNQIETYVDSEDKNIGE